MDERQSLLNVFKDPKACFIVSILNPYCREVPQKDAELSVKSRKQGNALFHKPGHDRLTHIKIFKFYCQSIAFAPNDSTELAIGYGNRSAFLFHIKKYQACIEDIDKALSIHKAKNFKEKLLDRKASCLKALRLPNNSNKLNSQRRSPTCATDVKKEDSENDNYALFTKEMTDIFEDIDIGYSEKYGRHLIAKQNFKPGDIVFVEKCYTQFVTATWTHTNCSHCLKTCWSGIPCDHCNWSMFCSKECKTEAWKKYHEIECPIISCLKKLPHDLEQLYLPLRTLITGLNDAGGLKNLKDEIASLDPTKDDCWHGFMDEDKFLKNRFHGVNSSSCEYKMQSVSGFDTEVYEIVALILTHFAECTTVFGKKFQLKENRNLINIPGAIFLGTLYAKLCRKIPAHKTIATIQNPQSRCIYEDDDSHHGKMKCCIRGQYVAPIANLMNHSCYPNVSSCFTEDGKIAIFALTPIKKNSQIFRPYYHLFHQTKKENRQKYLDYFGFVCDCIACKENWPLISKLEVISSGSEMKIARKYKTIMEKYRFKPGSDLELEVDIDEAINMLSKFIIKTFQGSKQPSKFICLLIDSLRELFIRKYGYGVQNLGEC